MKTLITTASSVALAAAGIALTFPAAASALPDTPGEWDIGAYDRCVNSGENQLPDKPNAQEDHIRYCCENSGGIWNAAAKKCVAPPAEPADAPVTKGPGRIPTGVLEPVRPTTTRVPGGIFVQNLTAGP
ncbi:MAG: hypothetical protein WAL26_10745 [Mycobacterium sp.]|jgi:hypothetical protein